MPYRFNYQFCLMLGLAGSTTQALAQVTVRLSPSDSNNTYSDCLQSAHNGRGGDLAVHGSLGQGRPLVGQLKPNPRGFYDIHGNVFEWCLDIYKAYPEGRAYSDTRKLKILRGGAYYCPSSILRSACRAEAQKPDYRWTLGGFRVVLAPPVDQVED